MSLKRAAEYLEKYGLKESILEFEVSSATVELAAKALACEPGEIAKTLSFLVEGKPILVVAAGDVKINNGKFKKEFATKAKMIAAEDVENLIGHSVGGVCPFGVNKDVKIYLDESLKKYEYVYPACGSSNSAIKLTPEKLSEITGYVKWVDVCKEAEHGTD